MTSPVDIGNQALEFIAAQTTITALNDGTPAGNAIGVIYLPTVQMLLRQMDPDFARFTLTTPTLSTGAPPPPWAFAYVYPTDCLRLRQIRPPPGAYDPFDPQPIVGNVAILLLSGVPEKAVLTDLANAQFVYTSSAVTENQWDTLFEQSVVRQLANPLAMAIAGRPDFAREILDEAARYEQISDLRDESSAQA